MSFKQAESLYRKLERRRSNGTLDEESFRVEVGKLLLRDRRGAFWMLDADSGAWVCNQGEGWTLSDPHALAAAEAAPTAVGGARPRKRRLRRVILVLALLLVVAAAVLLAQRLQLLPLPASPQATLQASELDVTIASPADDSQIMLGQAVAVESILRGVPDLHSVARVELKVNGEIVDSQAAQLRIQPGQTSLPLAQPWRPASLGEHEVVVTAYSDDDVLLGSASVTVEVIMAPDERPPDPVCVPDAALVADMTILPGTAFPPGARMDKVWRIRNTGSCAWGVGYELVRIQGEALGASSALPVPLTPAGESLDLTITFWAPEETGSYANEWRLESPDGQFFGPTLPLSIHVETLAAVNLPPLPPAGLDADVTAGGREVRLTWEDRTTNEDGFRIYRDDLQAGVGLVPADVELFIDENVACGNTYRYSVAAFNASGTSPISESVEAIMPRCVAPTMTSAPATNTPSLLPGQTPSSVPGATPSPVLTVTPPPPPTATRSPLFSDMPPSLTFTVVPTDIVAGGMFTITFEAVDDLALERIVVWGHETEDLELDTGRVFTCALEIVCNGTWPITWSREITASLLLVGVAFDSIGQMSEQGEAYVSIHPAR